MRAATGSQWREHSNGSKPPPCWATNSKSREDRLEGLVRAIAKGFLESKKKSRQIEQEQVELSKLRRSAWLFLRRLVLL
ncbi:hypothetical protein PGIGA_G00066560 [Pangasianodon gigas]|uniref:Uncharacterized protein n=1 Tax=Pangasianodon gigas TaxID=30993 RepID=A0ACC5X6M3_PANGG|nr:hypothetical protein [Pangasianodon gigas]